MADETRDVLEGLEGYRPGPWRKIRRPTNGNDDYWEIAWSDDGELVADGVYGENVNLIARAPNLVAEIQRLREALRPFAAFACGTPDGEGVPEAGCDCHNCNAARLLPPTGDDNDE